MVADSELDNWLDQYEEWKARHSGQPFASFAADVLANQPNDLVNRVRAAAEKLSLFERVATPSPLPARLGAGAEPVPGYRLQLCIGRGGFGEVWRAIGPGGIECALKFVPAGGLDAATEIRALEAVRHCRHPHLIALFGSWQQAGWMIVAMELAERSLADELLVARKDGLPGIPSLRLARYLTEAAAGLDHLAGNGTKPLQHRDVKPQNLLLVGNSVKVADFGLARIVDRSVVSHTGAMTAEYAPPEFFEGMTTRWSDQYSLAMTYCQLRGGRLPFQGSRAAIMRGHLSLLPDLSMLPAAERPVVARALSKTPGERWESCGAFATALSGVLHGKAVAEVRSDTYETVRNAVTLPSPLSTAAFDFDTESGHPPPVARSSAAAGIVALVVCGLLSVGLVTWAFRSPPETTILVKGVDPGASVSLDDRPVLVGDGGPVRLTTHAGSHTVTVHKPGFRPHVTQVVAPGGESITLEVSLLPERVPRPVAITAAPPTAAAASSPPVKRETPAPEPRSEDSATVRAKAMLALGDRLENTKWMWPDPTLTKGWFTLNANRTVTAGWHPQRGTWVVESPTTIRAVIMSFPRTPQQFLVDLEAGVLRNVQTGETIRLAK